MAESARKSRICQNLTPRSAARTPTAELDRVGEEDPSTLLRKEAMRRARTPQELWAIRTVEKN